uniref:peroxidase n=1 Tax=Fagus sylvatica TaxID=28930 RepID=A0A2N9J0Y7_FAGSY
MLGERSEVGKFKRTSIDKRVITVAALQASKANQILLNSQIQAGAFSFATDMGTYNIFLLVLIAAGAFLEANGKLSLSPTHYSSRCPNALSIVKEADIAAITHETSTGASRLHLHFHDCWYCWMIWAALQVREGTEGCPGVVSCADILALAAHDSVVYVGGPSWKSSLQRRDSTTANITAANTLIPAPTSNLSSLIENFSAQGL